MNEQEQREQELAEMQKQCKKNELNQLLQQKDYMARKVAFEVAEIIKTKFPDVAMPEYEKYQAVEEQAKQFRAELNTL